MSKEDTKPVSKTTGAMAAGTAVSRLTGVLRILALAYALGTAHLATSYNLANTTPNMAFDIVLGGVLSATFIPVFVDRLSTRTDREAWRAISAIVTLSIVILGAMTILFWILAPQVISAYTAFDHVRGPTFGAERRVAATLLRWFVPQIALYGIIALLTALLNIRNKFIAPMWVPIANNAVCIAVLLYFAHIASDHPSLPTISDHPGQIVLLGFGTTLGVGLQALLLVFSLKGAGLSRLRWRFDPRHEAVGAILRLGAWTFGFVVANQIALYVVLSLAVGAHGPDPVSAYTYAYTFMQMPYAVVAVSVMGALTPDLAKKWAEGDRVAFTRRFAGGLRAILAIIIPAALGLLLLAKPLIELLIAHGATSPLESTDTGIALSMFAIGLPGFCTFLYVVRVLQSMQRTKVAFYLYLVENTINGVLAIVFVHPLGVGGLALSLSIAYSISAVLGVSLLWSWFGGLGDKRMWAPLIRVCVASLAMAVVVLFAVNVSGANHGVILVFRVGLSVAAGILAYFGTAALMTGTLGSRR